MSFAVAAHAFPAAWLATFLFLSLAFGTAMPAQQTAFSGLALAGTLYVAFFERQALGELLARHRLLLLAPSLVALSIGLTGVALQLRDPAYFIEPLPPHIGLLPCVAPLAVMLMDRTRMRGFVAALALLSLWHAVALPLEAVTGMKWTWHGVSLLPREAGLFNYQASGLAWQVYFFPGIFLASFYLAAGAIGQERLFGRHDLDARTWLAASMLWAIATASLQSRSVLAATVAASLIGVVAFARTRQVRTWVVVGVLAACAVGLFVVLFSENKSSAHLRWIYLVLYLRRSLEPAWMLTGRGHHTAPDYGMFIPGEHPVVHSHNDIAQVFFAWGLPTLLAYLAFWFALLRLVARMWRQGRFWPALSLVAVLPSTVTDLGLHHQEKTVFFVTLAAMCAAFDTRPAQVLGTSSSAASATGSRTDSREAVA